MSWDSRRKPEYPERTHAEHANSTQKSPTMVDKMWSTPNNLPVTFIHSRKQLCEVLWSNVRLVLLPRVTIITPQHDQLPLFPPHWTKMRDLHNHRTLRKQSIIIFVKLVHNLRKKEEKTFDLSPSLLQKNPKPTQGTEPQQVRPPPVGWPAPHPLPWVEDRPVCVF